MWVPFFGGVSDWDSFSLHLLVLEFDFLATQMKHGSYLLTFISNIYGLLEVHVLLYLNPGHEWYGV